MRVGLATPIVTRLPGVVSDWEATAGPAELARIAQAADRLGFAHLTCSEHVAVPTPIAAERGGTYWDPLSTFGFLAGQTQRIRFFTQVLVLGYHHPLEIAKRYGTLDLVSGGRVTLGLGVGSLKEEFELLEVPFAGRGARADDAIRALRASFGTAEPEYSGDHYSFGGMQVDPHPSAAGMPLWIGGQTPRSLQRAVELGDGWTPFALGRRQVREMLDAVSPPSGFDVVLATPPLDPIGDPDGAARALHNAVGAGATVINAAVRATSADNYVAALEALAPLAELETA
ncbi:LLM class F420-dependent oxidoreductase [Gordonia alkaliphila]|uniref:LLM class F420-dependent oxidoreductase n=1 Tax=Gordonia alkaliphila TaxID=1053547 RepID=UPI001FF48078|nr:LLM class F420-dependent oxidoreductase [Gordonia alkaliphila]MCK0438941.1 LLM class F420-dependent oxidoreductase [Gordonia alkaliphila]